jgi:ribosomal protein S18 acetylase RimI-like enzyme
MIWWIQSVYIPEEYRRKGIFRALYRHVESLVKDDQNACGLRLYVEENNTRAIQTYRDLHMSEPELRVMESLAKND